MVAAGIILYGAAFVCFVLAAGNAATRLNTLALGLACCALFWFLQLFIPVVT